MRFTRGPATTLTGVPPDTVARDRPKGSETLTGRPMDKRRRVVELQLDSKLAQSVLPLNGGALQRLADRRQRV